jgi:hypothetical protein
MESTQDCLNSSRDNTSSNTGSGTRGRRIRFINESAAASAKLDMGRVSKDPRKKLVTMMGLHEILILWECIQIVEQETFFEITECIVIREC